MAEESVAPEEYSIHFYLNFKKETVVGAETICLASHHAHLSRFLLHRHEMIIDSVDLVLTSGKQPCGVENHDEDSVFVTLPPGIVSDFGGGLAIEVHFHFPLKTALHGLYKSVYKHHTTGEETYMASTHLEPTHARSVFPCIDLPASKSIFIITITVEDEPTFTAISNMPETDESRGRRRSVASESQTFTFQPTPKMSTYLVGFAVGDFDYIEDVTTSGTLVRIYTPAGRAESGRFSLEVATKVFPFFEEFFDFANPLPKLDLIAVASHPIGAMENWGLLTFRETYLLTTESTTAQGRERIAAIVAHEQAHCWMGNLVTMANWNDLFLKEGFATWLSFVARDHLFKDWEVWSTFLSETWQVALNLDATNATHPVRNKSASNAEISSVFDEISYEKGCSVIRMAATFLGQEQFRKYMQKYVNASAYASSDFESFLDIFDDQDVKEIFSDFILRPGFPLVSVKHSENLLVLTQTRFKEDGKFEDEEPWKIPLRVRQGSGEIKNVLFSTKQISIPISDIGESFVVINADGASFFRTQYDEFLLGKIQSAFQRDLITNPADRFTIVSDLIALYKSGNCSLLALMRVIHALHFSKHNSHSSVLRTVLDFVVLLRGIVFALNDKNALENFDKFCACILHSDVKDELRDSHHHTAIAAELHAFAMVYFRDPASVQYLKENFANLVQKNEPPLAHLMQSTLIAAIRNSESKSEGDEFSLLTGMYSKSRTAEEQTRIGNALLFVQSDENLLKVLHWIKASVRHDQIPRLLHYMSKYRSCGAVNAFASFLRSQWDDWVVPAFGGDATHISAFVSAWAAGCLTQDDAAGFNEFFETHPNEFAKQAVKEATEQIQWRLAFIESQREALLSLFSSVPNF